jgi:hypothetical protein
LLATLSPLKVSGDGHILVDAQGRPFFWLGDTAWNLFSRLNEGEAARYLKHRRRQGFTVIQAHLLDGDFDRPGGEASQAFLGGDFDRPNPAYWRKADRIIDEAARQGLYFALLPAWARRYSEGKSPRLGDAAQAERYGAWLGRRYRHHSHIIWILGGDAKPTRHEIYDALAAGLTRGSGRGAEGILISYHPPGGTYRPPATSTSEWYHDKVWLDFNMIQSGHRVGNRNYARIAEDYAKTPAKPTLDSEPAYEAHPILHSFANGEFKATELRRRAYWSVLAGAFGFTYGANGVWQMDSPGRIQKDTHHNLYWYDALDLPGAQQMAHVKNLFTTRLEAGRVPDNSILASPPGDADDLKIAARSAGGEVWMIYSTNGSPFRVRLDKVAASRIQAWWFNPRNGLTYAQNDVTSYKPFAEFAPQGEREFAPPGRPDPDNDWILILEPTSRAGVPGRASAPASPRTSLRTRPSRVAEPR